VISDVGREKFAKMLPKSRIHDGKPDDNLNLRGIIGVFHVVVVGGCPVSARYRILTLLAVSLACITALVPQALEPMLPLEVVTSPNLAPPRIRAESAPRLRLISPDMPLGAVGVFGSSRFRPVAGPVAFSPNGKLVVTGQPGEGGAVWEFTTGRRLCQFASGANTTFAALGFSHDDREVVAVEYEKSTKPQKTPIEVCRYDSTTGKLLSRVTLDGLEGEKPKLAISPDGTAVFAGNEYGEQLTRYDVRSGRVVWTFQVAGENLGATGVSADGTRVAAFFFQEGQKSNRLILNAATGKEETRAVGGAWPTWSLALSPDGKTLVTPVPLADADAAAIVWDVPSGAVRKLPKGPFRVPKQVAFSPDGKRVGIADENWLVVYDTSTWKPAYTLNVYAYSDGFAFSSDSATLAIPWNALGLWDAATGQQLPQSADPVQLRTYDELHFSEDGATLSASGIGPPEMTTWEVTTGHEITRLSGDAAREANPFYWSHVSPGGRFRVKLKLENQIVEEVATRRVLRTFQIEASGHVSADGRHLFGHDGSKLFQWDVATGAKLGTLVDDTGVGTIRVGFEVSTFPHPRAYPSPCGRFVAVVPRYWPTPTFPMRLFDPVSRKQLCEVTLKGVPGLVAWAADGNRMAVAKNRDIDSYVSAVTVLEMPSGRVAIRCDIPDIVQAIEFSPDLRTLLTSDTPGDNGGCVRLYEVASGRLRHRFGGDDPWAGVGTFSRDGRFLATAHGRRPVVVWNIREPLAKPVAGGIEMALAALGSQDAEAAFGAVRLLTAFPDVSLPLLADRIIPPDVPSAERIVRLIASLAANEFTEREAAMKELEDLGPFVEPTLRRAVNSVDSPEARDRLNRLLARLRNLPPNELHPVRAVEAVEWMATPNAVKLLQRWAVGPDRARLTEEAKSALTRLRMPR